MYNALKQDSSGTSKQSNEFKAVRGWFSQFRQRSGIHSVGRHGEAASGAAVKFIGEFKNFVVSEEFTPDQVFDCDKTSFFWKKMPERTYIAEEKALPGQKPMKDRLTLLFCANASGDLKIKPLLVYLSEKPRVFKNNNVIKSKLSECGG